MWSGCVDVFGRGLRQGRPGLLAYTDRFANIRTTMGVKMNDIVHVNGAAGMADDRMIAVIYQWMGRKILKLKPIRTRASA